MEEGHSYLNRVEGWGWAKACRKEERFACSNARRMATAYNRSHPGRSPADHIWWTIVRSLSTKEGRDRWHFAR